MRKTGFGRLTLLAVAWFVAVSHPAFVEAQRLFNSPTQGGQSRAGSSTGSLFSGNLGFRRATGKPASNAAESAGSGFVGRSNQSFVGRAASSATGNTSPGRRALNRVGNGINDNTSGARSPAGRANAAAGSSRTNTMTYRHRIAFNWTPLQSTVVSKRLQEQLAKLAIRNSAFAQIKTVVEPQGLVRLKGQVPSATTAKLAAILVGLEPGVREVHNELVVVVDGH